MSGFAVRNYLPEPGGMTHAEAASLFATARNPEAGKPLQNNTRLFKRGEDYAVRLHSTDVVTIHADGSYTLDTGGWRTVTTKDRINGYAPVRLGQDKGVWEIGFQGVTYAFNEGMRLYPNGIVTGVASPEDMEHQKLLRKKINRYAKDFTAALYAGEVEAPGPGDCFICQASMGGGSHIEAHADESYFVPSLLVKALKTAGASRAATNDAYALMTNQPERLFSKDGGFIREQIQRAIRKHCLRETGLAA